MYNNKQVLAVAKEFRTNHCVGKLQTDDSINWLGLDKYGKFIYGISGILQLVSGGKLEIIAQSIFGGSSNVLLSNI